MARRKALVYLVAGIPRCLMRILIADGFCFAFRLRFEVFFILSKFCKNMILSVFINKGVKRQLFYTLKTEARIKRII